MRPSGRRLLVRLGVGVAGLVGCSTAAAAHGPGHAGPGPGATGAAFVVVLWLPALAGLVGGHAILRHRDAARPTRADRASGAAVGLLLVGLGAASLLPAAGGHRWPSVAGGAIGAALAAGVVRGRPARATGGGTHADLTLGAIAGHRLVEGVVVGAMYAAGAAVGLAATVLLAGHAALETAVVGDRWATPRRRRRAAGALVLVQVGYVGGAVAGLAVGETLPPWAETVPLAVVGGVLLVVGALRTRRSIARGADRRSAADSRDANFREQMRLDPMTTDSRTGQAPVDGARMTERGAAIGGERMAFHEGVTAVDGGR